MKKKLMGICRTRLISAVMLLALLCAGVPAYAQKMWVESFKYVDDPTAIIEGTSRVDVDGNRAALIKVITKLKNLRFDVGTLGVVDTEDRGGGEIWVYVRQGTKKITIGCDGYEQIRNHKFDVDIKSGATYELVIGNEVVTAVRSYDNEHSERAVINIYPPSARVLINNMPVENKGGVVESILSLGIYSITASAPRYHTYNGDLDLDGTDSVKVVDLRLKQAFGWITIDEKNLDGVTLTVDDTMKVSDLRGRIAVPSGQHNVKIMKELCAVNEHEVTVTDSALISIKPVFLADFASLSLSVGGDAGIYIDGVLKGIGKWKGDIGSGKHIIECRKSSHRTTTREITVVKNHNETITLDTPTPIYGHIVVSANAEMASVTVDGKGLGFTPVNSTSDVLVGRHTLVISKQGYRTETREIELKDGETCDINIDMANVADVKITSSPSGAYLTIDGKPAGYTPYLKEMPLGTYALTLSRTKYKSISRKITVGASNSNNYNFPMKRIYYKKNTFYMEGIGQAGSMLGYGGDVGIYIHNFNVQVDYVMGLSDSETIYWNVTPTDNSVYQDVTPSSATYKATYMGGKIGYGILAGNRFLFTPQVGFGITKYTSSNISYGSYSPPENTYSAAASAGLRLNYALLSWLGLSVTPEYSFAISKGKIYEEISNVSSEMKSWGEGFNCKVGLNIFF
jgi:hypothetical protein